MRLPKAEHEAPEWQAAMEALILVAMAFQLVVDNPDFLFLVPSQRLKRLNHHPQWRAGNFGENYDAQVKIPRSPISIAR
jgi:hypothetical protein